MTVMSPEYREIIALFATSGAAMRCKEVCRHLGLGTEPRHVEGMRLMSIPWFRRGLSYAAWHLWSLFLRASVMVRSNF
ncbi:hypothetical protein ABZ705_33770, partial [Streptomyces sp. NPDC006984]